MTSFKLPISITNRHQISCHFTVKPKITKDLLHFICIRCHYHLTPDPDLALHIIVFIFYIFSIPYFSFFFIISCGVSHQLYVPHI